MRPMKKNAKPVKSLDEEISKFKEFLMFGGVEAEDLIRRAVQINKTFRKEMTYDAALILEPWLRISNMRKINRQ